MRVTRFFFAILLSVTLFVQGVAATTMRACHMGAAAVAQSGQQASGPHHHDQSEMTAEMAAMDMASNHHVDSASQVEQHEYSAKSNVSKRSSCAWCAACCMNLAVSVTGIALPDLFATARTVFPPLAVAPPSRLPSGWDRPPRA